uniref:Neurotransmitter-gated ion-channel ligand-binding domain-containing protein n=1 Tax=Panagrolaimus sp. ES5 TaxID=591445 RepID=A0AC34GTJ8_9BILA
MSNQKVRVNFFRSEKGKWLSVLNLRASFSVPDTVDVESRPAADVDFDQDDKDITIINITPLPMLKTLETPQPQKSVHLTTPIYSEASTLEPSYNYPILTEQEMVPKQSTTKSLITSVSETEATTTSSILWGKETTTIETAIDYPINDMIPGIMNLGLLIIPHKLRHRGDTFVLTAREVLHTDSLGRNESVLRDLLSNLTYLEYEEDFSSYYRDHGGSFLLPVLKAVNYDNTSVPVAFSDIPLNVKVKLNLIHLANFDSEQMEYTIDLEMEMRWFDIRLANNYSKPIRIREKQILDMVFRPDPYFVNSKYSYFHMVTFPNFRMRIMPTGLIIYTMRVTLLPSCSMTFCRFPHDSQECDLLISSIAYPQSFVNLMWHDEPIQFSSRISLPELKIKRMSTEDCIVEGKLIASSCLRLVFNLERDGARYIVEKYIPSTLAMMFAWVAPYVPYNYEDVRIITPITVLLTLVQMEKGDIKVRTSYLTSMDQWFAAMKAFSVLSLEKQAHRATNQYSKELFEAEKRRLTALYHRLDTASRFLSPVVFIIFFIVYVLYIAQGDESYCLNKSNL